VSVPRAVRARAFAPGHITGIFAPVTDARDPRARGSSGAGVVLELGVIATAEFRPGGRSTVRVSGDGSAPLPISTEVARRLRPKVPGLLTVRLEHQLPIGQGFGMSAAGACATALAVGAVAHRSRRTALEVAHLADLFGGGGLGGVASIVGGGGLEFRMTGGLPPRGIVRHQALSGHVWAGVVGGPMLSPRLLRSDRFLERVRDASEELGPLLRAPSDERFFSASERFTDRLDLAPPALRRTISELRRRDCWAAQAMFGRSFFARARGPRARAETIAWLQRARVPAVEIAAARQGPRVTTSHVAGS